MQRFTLYGSPHSLPTYKVALMLRMSEEPFAFRYVSFQKAMHRASEFLALSRWRQVPVLVDGERAYVQSAAIVEYLSEALDRFRGPAPAARQAIREWLYWDVDALFPAIFGCYAAELDRKKLLPLNIDPAIAAFRHKGAETALLSLDNHLQPDEFLCTTMPSVADIFLLGDMAFAEVCGFDLKRWPNVAAWAARLRPTIRPVADARCSALAPPPLPARLDTRETHHSNVPAMTTHNSPVARMACKREEIMADPIYKVVEVVGTSEQSISKAIDNAINKASGTLRNLGWFEVAQMRGAIKDGKVERYQVTLKVGFTLDPPASGRA